MTLASILSEIALQLRLYNHVAVIFVVVGLASPHFLS